MLSFRCRHRPEATSIHPLASTTSSGTSGSCQQERASFQRSRHRFRSGNQVTTKVKSDPMLIKECHAYSRSVGMAFAKLRSFTSPSDDFTNIFLHSFRQTPTPYSLAPAATMDENQPRLQLLTIAGRRPTKACTSALAQSRRVIIICPSELVEGNGTLSTPRLSRATKVMCPQEHLPCFSGQSPTTQRPSKTLFQTPQTHWSHTHQHVPQFNVNPKGGDRVRVDLDSLAFVRHHQVFIHIHT